MQDGLYAEITTPRGPILIKLYFDKVPMTVANFVGLAEGKIENPVKPLNTPFYDGLTFHRVISKANGDDQDFMVQGGDPKGNGSGGPEYSFPDEFHPALKHNKPGILSMANSGPNTNGSQFFITIVPTPWLDNKHSVFGEVADSNSQKIVNALMKGEKMQQVKIIRVGKEAEAFDAPKVFNEKTNEFRQKQAELKKKLEEESKAAQGKFLEYVKATFPTAKSTPSGLHYIIEKEGTGAMPVKGSKVSVHYAGFLTDGQKFDSSYDRNQPIEFQLGIGQVIPGWDEGIMLLKVGTKAKLIIPSTLGYGTRQAGPIPPNSTLLFDVELLEIK